MTTKNLRKGAQSAQTAGTALAVIAALVLIAAVITSIVLLMHTQSVCIPDQIDPTALDCTGTRHDLTAAGVTALIGGIVQVIVLAALSRLCISSGDQSEALAELLDRARADLDEESDDSAETQP